MKAQQSIVTVVIDGKTQSFDQPAVVLSGSTLVPMRGVFEALGAKVSWDESTKTVTGTKGDITIKLTLGQSTAYINDKAVTLSAVAQTINGSTMVPLRFVSEALGARVGWNAAEMKATITSSGYSEVPVPLGTHKSVDVGLFTEGGIDIYYGNHTYGVANQEEYDAVVDLAKQAVADVKSKYKSIDDLPSGIQRYLSGERYTGARDSVSSQSDLDLLQAGDLIGKVVADGATKEQVLALYQADAVQSILSSEPFKDYGDTFYKHLASAYRYLVLRDSNTVTRCQTASLIYDLLGIDNAVLGSKPSEIYFAQVVILIGNKWYGKYDSASLGQGMARANMDKIPSTYEVIAQPINYTITPGSGVKAN